MKYRGLKLTPNVFADILIELYDGKQFERQDAIASVKKCFTEQGGILENRNYIDTFKKASQKLKDKGIVNNGYGIWTLNYQLKDVEVVVQKETDSKTYCVDKEIGSGNSSVYVYYYDAYKALADIKGQSVWECKIGRTDREPIQRIINQVGTCYPETPHIALIIYCEDSAKLETAIHSILKFKNRWIKDAPGDEWFMTSPEEIETIYFSILQEQ